MFPITRASLRAAITLAATLVALAVGASSALAATYTVNTTADSSDTGGCTTATICSLRDAVAAANANSGSTIDVPAGTYTLNTGNSPLGQLELTEPTTIVGAGARSTTVDGNGISRVFAFDPGATSDLLTISDLTVTGGDETATGSGDGAAAGTDPDPGDGGGILSLGELDLEHDAITGNTAALGGGGVMDGTIHTAQVGPAMFNGVTISGNTVKGGTGNGQGGGAVVAAVLTMTNSTIADNTVENAGANEGGGLVNSLGGDASGVSATLVNDTITGNVATEPVSSPAGDIGGGISGDDVTFFVNDVPEVFDSVIDATNTIVADNTADGTEQDCALIDTSSADGATSSHNIEGDTTCGFSDSASKTTTAIDLGKLADNGGPTDTLLPAADSPAVNAGTNTGCPATDERGVTRPQGGTCDIGAVELAPPSATTGPASAIGPAGATLAGTGSNPAVLAGTAVIDYGTTTSYGKTASAGAVDAGAKSVALSTALHGLLPHTTYHYRVVVTTTDGTATGADRTFTTTIDPTKLTVACSPTHVITGRRTTCTVKVADLDGVTITPTGRITFKASPKGGKLAACTLKKTSISATGSCKTTYTPTGATGKRTITASYGGDSDHAASHGTAKLTLEINPCPAPTGSLSGDHLGPATLGQTRAQTRKHFARYAERGRKNMDFFCLGTPGIRVGYLGDRAVLALTADTHYHLGSVKPGGSLPKAERTLHVIAHVRIGTNIWYLTSGGSVEGIMKVRHGEVQEVGIAERADAGDTRTSLDRFMSSFPQ